MFDSIRVVIGVHVQRCQVFHAHVQQLRTLNPHLSQVESHKQNSPGVPNTRKQRFETSRWPRDWSITPNLSFTKRGIQVSAHIAEKFCDSAFIDQETAHNTFVAQLCRYH
ncbi:hypothetical protein TNCV_1721681 [Trichonephila clavipes]|nr:hypothetical protein TNCV_1721681 [Trichonephila clavipes]